MVYSICAPGGISRENKSRAGAEIGKESISHSGGGRDKGTGGIMDSHQLSVGGQHAVLRALGTGRAALHHLHRLCAGRSLLFQKFPVLPGHQNDLADQRTLRKGADAPLHHGLPPPCR